MKRWQRKHTVWLLLYLSMVASIIISLQRIRHQVQITGQDSSVQQDWEDWVQAAREQASSKGPVQRRVPRAKAPPLTLLMNDHFLVCVTTSCILASALFITLMFLIQGSYNTRTSLSEEPVRDPGHER